jgi:hypothetical protein
MAAHVMTGKRRMAREIEVIQGTVEPVGEA